MHPTVQIALLGVASGLLTLLVGEVFRRWRSGSDMIRDLNVEADTENKTMGALTDAFRVIAERQAEDINDLRERLRRVEDALLLAHQRNDTLAEENARIGGENTRLRRERDRLHGRNEQLEGELRMAKQVADSYRKVYGQAGIEDEPPETTQ